METAHSPESRSFSPRSGGVDRLPSHPPRTGTAAHSKCVYLTPYDLTPRGHVPHVGRQEEHGLPVTEMLTELSLCCMGAACGQILGTGAGLGLQHVSRWSPADRCGQNRSVLAACCTKPGINKCQSGRRGTDRPRAGGCVEGPPDGFGWAE